MKKAIAILCLSLAACGSGGGDCATLKKPVTLLMEVEESEWYKTPRARLRGSDGQECTCDDYTMAAMITTTYQTGDTLK